MKLPATNMYTQITRHQRRKGNQDLFWVSAARKNEKWSENSKKEKREKKTKQLNFIEKQNGKGDSTSDIPENADNDPENKQQ